ncbi:hypothetical protein N0V93_007099 [Gnomoniopsis smithogilvyi]|uniref:Beta-xylanase n=1 Tax=Gnomoniopsis smithogilvyi TaxID=1191159 RepID=A0A9W9CV25_9PEZI|nr:hypothetical protein N0V93_007099 [Gnomoniopsis smithogilvyi]
MAKLSLILISGLLAGLSPLASAQQQQSQGLNELFQAAGKLFFGTATDTNNFNDTAYLNVLNNRNEFGILVPENSMKWQPTEPTEGNFQFTNPDQVRALAVKNNMMFRCHTLTWFQQLPQFITTTAWTRNSLTAAIQTHIANVVGHYKGSCYSWDVVNEALNDGNGTFRNSVFFTTLGTDFIPISFQAAEAADPNAKLYYNDFSLEFNSDKTAAALDIVRLVQNSSARIDGVGFQGHFTVGGTPSAQNLMTVFNRFTSLGVEIAITELDIRMTLPSNATTVAQQAKDYVSVVNACLGTPKCVGIVVWQFTDKYSWVPSTFAGTGEACLYDQNMSKKPAWTSVAAALQAAATARPGNATATVRPTATGTGRPSGVAAPTGALGAMQAGSSNGTVQVSESPRAFVSLGAALLLVVSSVFVMFA